uniref:Potassium two pore domain channel subfamily K member 12 n=1 Tax=Cyprinus carpio TaxID=7962 RepID=A0A8C2IMV9_CYPCA
MPAQRLQGCRSLHINEDNGRFLLLAVLIIVYLLCGAAVFSAIERPSELRAHGRWNRTLLNFSDTFNISLQDLSSFLKEYEAAIAAGVRVDALRPRWDFTGAFYFVGTVVSTIGKLPNARFSQLCSASALFFRLWTWRSLPCAGVNLDACSTQHHRAFVSHLCKVSLSWQTHRPVTNCSLTIISCCASAMYTPVEGWAYLDSLYFCFVTFSTIGVGDLVSSQNAEYGYQGLYRLANFIFILTGVCCIYSLFNVISIVIKQVLNWMLGKMSCLCCQRCNKANAFLGRRNAIRPGSRLRRGRFGRTPDSDGPCDSDTEGRRLSGEMISMRDLTGSNKISLAIMQKQLSESANGYPRTVCGSSRQNGFSGGVGALGIMNNRLAETSDSR